MVCKAEFSPEMLGSRIKIEAAPGVNFEEARELARRAAGQRLEQPMLLGWLEADSGRRSPAVECCDEDKPGWLVYCQSRGGEVAVEVGRGDYFFVFREGAAV